MNKNKKHFNNKYKTKKKLNYLVQTLILADILFAVF